MMPDHETADGLRLVAAVIGAGLAAIAVAVIGAAWILEWIGIAG